MDTGLDISGSAIAALQNQKVAAPQAGGRKSDAAIDKAANEFESVFISQFLGAMFSGIKTDGITGGGEGEEMFRSLMLDQYAGAIQKQGGLGLAASVKAQMLKMQEQ
jgi:Rod binding domain-containing protein